MTNSMFELSVEKSNKRYKWVTEPNACQKCKDLEGKVFETLEDFEAARPHPHCKCSYEEIIEPAEKDKNIIQTAFTQAQEELEEQNLENEEDFWESFWDLSEPENISEEQVYANSLNEMGVYSKQQIEAQEQAVKQIENLKLKTENLQNKIEKTIPILENEISELQKIEKDNTNYSENKLQFVKELISDIFKSKEFLLNLLLELKKCYQKLQVYESTANAFFNINEILRNLLKIEHKTDSIKQRLSEEIAVILADKQLTILGGYAYSKYFDMPEAYDLLKIALNSENYNKDYVDANGILYDKIEDYTNSNDRYRIRDRVTFENVDPNNLKVMVFNPDSSIVEKIRHSKSLEKYLHENLDNLRVFGKPKTNTIEFESIDSDLYSAIHGAEVTNMHLDKEGNLHMVIEDLYNFNAGRTSVKGRVGRKLQEERVLEPYYVICPIIIPKEELNKF